MSVINATQNRKGLELSLATWLKVADEVIICDWGSDEPISFTDSRVRVLRVDNRPWNQSGAQNYAAHHATGELLLKCDTDYELDAEAVNTHLHLVKEGVSFVRGKYGNARNENEKWLNGFLFVFKSDFERVNGYNERFQGWGYDDDDLYDRLRKAGLDEKPLDNDYVYHRPHLRGANWADKNIEQTLRENQQRAVERPWGVEDTMWFKLRK